MKHLLKGQTHRSHEVILSWGFTETSPGERARVQHVGLSTSKRSATQAGNIRLFVGETPDPGVIVVHCKVLIINTTKQTARTSGKRYGLAQGVDLYIFPCYD